MEVECGFNIFSSLVLVSTTVILIYLYVDKKFRYWTDQGVESQTKLEFLREIVNALKRPRAENIIEAYKLHGRLYGACLPFPALWVSEPELIKHILVKDFNLFRNRRKFDFGDSFLKMMIPLLDDGDWKRIRSLMSPTFTSSRIRKMTYLVKQSAESLAKRFNEYAEKGEEFNCKEFMSEFTVDITASTAFATNLNAQDNKNMEFVKNARMITNRDVPKFTHFIITIAPKLADYLNLKIFPAKAANYFRSVVLKILEGRKEQKIRGNDFLQLMMDAQEGILENSAEDLKEISNEINDNRIRPEHKKMTLEEIVAQCVLFITAGHDPTTTTLTFFCQQMALNPEWQEKLLKEIDDTWKEHGDIDFDTLSKMPYLDAVLNEILRIQNPGLLLSRIVSEDCELANTGIKLKKGMIIFIPTQAMHHDPEWFPEPEKFNPERFLPENKNSIQPYTFLPFGEGPRRCIGMRYITMVMKLCIVHMLKDVKFVATEETGKPLENYYGQGMQIKKVILKIEKRSH